jgi:hypothetical protein
MTLAGQTSRDIFISVSEEGYTLNQHGAKFRYQKIRHLTFGVFTENILVTKPNSGRYVRKFC